MNFPSLQGFLSKLFYFILNLFKSKRGPLGVGNATDLTC